MVWIGFALAPDGAGFGSILNVSLFFFKMVLVFSKFYPGYLEKPQGEIDPEASVWHPLEWPYLPILLGDIFVPCHKVLS